MDNVIFCIGDMIQSPVISAIATIVGIIADIAILVMTIYTLYITAFSKRMKFISVSFQHNIFYGEHVSISLMNRSLHAIPVQELFVMKQENGIFYRVCLFKSSDPIVIDSWNVKKLQSDTYTAIENWSGEGETVDSHDIFKDYVIGVVSGEKVLWIKPYKKAPLRSAKKVYRRGDFTILTVAKRGYEDYVLSEGVNCVIHIREKDMNGQYHLHTVLGIAGMEDGGTLLLSSGIRGYNMISECGCTEAAIKKTLRNTLGLEKEDVFVEMLNS